MDSRSRSASSCGEFSFPHINRKLSLIKMSIRISVKGESQKFDPTTMSEDIFNPKFTRLRVPYILMIWLWIRLFGNVSFWITNFHDSYFRFIFRPPLCLLVFLFASSIGIVFIHTYTLLQLKVQIYMAIGIIIGIFAALVWLFLAHRESKSIKRKLHTQYIIQQNMKNQVLWNYQNFDIFQNN